MLAVANEGQNFRDRRIFGSQRLHRAQPLGKNARTVKQLLIERTYGSKPLAGKFAALHADDVETFEARVLAIDQTKGNHVAADAANAADHRLRSDPDELVNRRQAAHVDKIADLAMAAQRRRCREDDVVSDDTIMANMAVIHEITARADPRDAATLFRSDVHRHAFANGASLPDFEPGRLAAIAQVLRRSSKRTKRIYHAAGSDRRVAGHAHMRDQFAVRADDDVGADH